MIITRATEYSIAAVLFLAARHPAPVTTKREICEAEAIPPVFLTKILQPLIKSGVVKSKRGVAGGFGLVRDPEETTLWDVLLAVEEPMSLNVCLTGGDACGRATLCPVHDLWAEAREGMEEIFSRKSLARIARERVERSERWLGKAALG
jgi:Rrf2 family protein